MFGHDNKDDQQDTVVQPATDQPMDDVSSDAPDVIPSSPAPAAPQDQPADDVADEPVNEVEPASDDEDVPVDSGDEGLLDIKREALQELSPLIDQLDQTPDERFKTTMMMLQATDDKSLIPKVYEAAKQIEDDKERAQALLDIINEINYFTQKKD